MKVAAAAPIQDMASRSDQSNRSNTVRSMIQMFEKQQISEKQGSSSKHGVRRNGVGYKAVERRSMAILETQGIAEKPCPVPQRLLSKPKVINGDGKKANEYTYAYRMNLAFCLASSRLHVHVETPSTSFSCQVTGNNIPEFKLPSKTVGNNLLFNEELNENSLSESEIIEEESEAYYGYVVLQDYQNYGAKTNNYVHFEDFQQSDLENVETKATSTMDDKSLRFVGENKR